MAKKLQFPNLVPRQTSLKPSTLFGATRSSSSSNSASGGEAARLPGISDLKKLSFSSPTVATGINFGRPSNPGGRTTASQPSATSNLLSNLITGGSSGILGSLTGIGGLVDDFKSLFGDSTPAAPPPLVEFRLPGSINDTLTIASTGSTKSLQSTVTQAPVPPQVGSQANSIGTIAVQAVKTALLSNSSLADVIMSL